MAGVRSGYSHCDPLSTPFVCTYVASLRRQLLNRRRAGRVVIAFFVVHIFTKSSHFLPPCRCRNENHPIALAGA
jgi:hypothetical protein